MTPAADLRAEAEALARQLPGLNFKAEASEAAHIGSAGRRRPGTGEHFWQYRRYAQEDAADRVDWRRSAKGHDLFVRETELEPLGECVELKVVLLGHESPVVHVGHGRENADTSGLGRSSHKHGKLKAPNQIPRDRPQDAAPFQTKPRTIVRRVRSLLKPNPTKLPTG